MVKRTLFLTMIVGLVTQFCVVQAATPTPYPYSTRETNHQSWITLSNSYANPLKQKWIDNYASALGTFSAPSTSTSTAPYYTYVDFVGIAKAAGDSTSPYYQRSDLANYASDALDWAVSGLTVDGYWWKSGDSRTGDANTNRFALIPILDAARYMRNLSAGETRWQSTWKTPLQTAINAQKASYAGTTSWDDQSECDYANQDVYYLVMLALSADLYNSSTDLQSAKDWMKCIAKQQQPDGALYYVNNQNDMMIYHLIDIKLINRYYELTNDTVALQVLRRNAEYVSLEMADSGQVEGWSQPWWKQEWSGTGSVDRMGFVTAAGASNNTNAATGMWLALSYVGPAYHGLNTIYAMPFAETAFDLTESGRLSAAEFVKADRNIRGIRGRYNTWYYGMGAGGGLRNTFVGGMVDDPSASNPLAGSFRGAITSVDQTSQPSNTIDMGYFLSGNNDKTGYALDLNNGGAFSAQYRLASAVIDPQTPLATDWQATQSWYVSKRGAIGIVTTEAVGPRALGDHVTGWIALGPETITSLGSNEYDSGSLHAKLYDSFGTISSTTVPVYARSDEANGIKVASSTISGGVATVGTRYTYSVWVGPETETPPATVTALSSDQGFTATWADGYVAAVVFNPSTAQTITVPWTGSTPRVYKGATQQSVTPSGGNLSLSAAARDVFLITSSSLDTTSSATATGTPQPTPTASLFGSSGSGTPDNGGPGAPTAETSHITLTSINDLPVFVSSEKPKTAQQIFVMARTQEFTVQGIARSGSTVHIKVLDQNIDDTVVVGADSSFTFKSGKELIPGHYTLRVELVDRGKLRNIPDLELSVKDKADVTVQSIRTVTSTVTTLPGSSLLPEDMPVEPYSDSFSAVTIHLEDAKKQPLANAEVRFLPDSGSSLTEISGKTDSRGTVTLAGVSKKITTVSVVSADLAGAVKLNYDENILGADALSVNMTIKKAFYISTIQKLVEIALLNTILIGGIVGLIVYLLKFRRQSKEVG